MEKPVEHDLGSSVSTVAGSTASGAVKGVGALLLAGAAVTAGVVGLAALAVNFPLAAGAAVATGVVAAVTAPVWAPFAGLGAAYGAVKGVSKVRKENQAYKEAAQNIGNQNVEMTKQAYMAGVRDGQVGLMQQIQEAAIAEQQQQAKFAERFAKKGTVTPESIIQQREAAAGAQHQVG
jgi:hypothetical protein